MADLAGLPSTRQLSTRLLSKGVAVLDGAMATQLEARGVDTTSVLWSAVALEDNLDAIRAVHESYFAAGAQVATTNSYQATVPGFVAAGLTEDQARWAITRSATLARQARADWMLTHPGSDLLVAGSIGPYGAYLADGSEYRGDYTLSREHYADFHRPRLQALAEGGVDLFAVETQPKLDEARAVIDLVTAEFPGTPAWVSFQLRDACTLADGTPLAEAAKWADDQSTVVAVGINCVPPQMVEDALGVLAAHTRSPLLCYPNSGDVHDPATGTWRPPAEPEPIADHVSRWIAAGAQLIGGCCRTSPHDIAEIARQVRLRESPR
ncbi:homocysteine S-methyltransferase [Propionibacterium sp.]|uniref:homocysteine S-methyltransferase n=1 Tax=Propionibacterium sp. TaxID=1977903 RepID=UPI0039E97ED4